MGVFREEDIMSHVRNRAKAVRAARAVREPNRRFSCEPLERRTLLAGVTLITHGFESGGSADLSWGTAMAQAIATRAGPETSVFDLIVDGSGSASLQPIAGQPTTVNPNGEIVIFLNWSALSNNLIHQETNTAYIANAVAPIFTETFPALGINFPLADLPIHLIGHSRGGSLVSALAGDLGAEGIWVDQLTTLDPHPVQNFPLITLPDPDAVVYSNVLFADNYYATDDTSNITGESIQGSHNVKLNGVLTSIVPASDHSAVHSYYDGTIDTGALNDGGGAAIDPTWYTDQGTGPRNSIGFDYSLIAGGVRPADGIGLDYNGTAARVPVPNVAGPQWANIGNLALTDSGSTFQVGQTLHAQYLFEDDSNAATVSLYLDTDQNPLDGSPNYQVASDAFAEQTGVLQPTNAIQPDTSNVPPGQYYLFAKITDGQTTRYAYAAAPVTLTSAPNSVSGIAYQDITGDGFSGDDTRFAGVTINLFQADGKTLVSTTTTAADGSYSFDNLPAGSYVVNEAVPTGWTATAGAGGYTAILSSGNGATE